MELAWEQFMDCFLSMSIFNFFHWIVYQGLKCNEPKTFLYSLPSRSVPGILPMLTIFHLLNNEVILLFISSVYLVMWNTSKIRF